MMALLLHLQARGHCSGKDLARLPEVSERTVQRDVEALVAAGIPVRSSPGPPGGYRLAGGYRTRLTGVGLDEAGALAFLGLAGPAEQLGLGELLEGARIKVWASLTGQARDRTRHVSERFHLDPARWYGKPEPVPWLPQLAGALWRDRRTRIEYVRDGIAVTREISPLGLVLASGQWYLVAQRDEQRHTYRVLASAQLSPAASCDAPACRRPSPRCCRSLRLSPGEVIRTAPSARSRTPSGHGWPARSAGVGHAQLGQEAAHGLTKAFVLAIAQLPTKPPVTDMGFQRGSGRGGRRRERARLLRGVRPHPAILP